MRQDTRTSLTFAIIVGVAMFVALIFLTACTPADTMVCTEYANGGVECQRFPAPLSPTGAP